MAVRNLFLLSHLEPSHYWLSWHFVSAENIIHMQTRNNQHSVSIHLSSLLLTGKLLPLSRFIDKILTLSFVVVSFQPKMEKYRHSPPHFMFLCLLVIRVRVTGWRHYYVEVCAGMDVRATCCIVRRLRVQLCGGACLAQPGLLLPLSHLSEWVRLGLDRTVGQQGKKS